MTAVGNDVWIFNSGIMVIEPSNCTFNFLMDRRKDIISYNGGDQGFLNEVFVWWHRLPRRVNFLKNFWANTTLEASVKNELFGADPPKVYSIHYLGLKPWNCYRDYDCNWNVGDQRVYASDVAHKSWWKFHDGMDENLQEFCGLTKRRKIELDWERKMARQMGFSDEHWKINITDSRQEPRLGMFDKSLPCFGCGIEWVSLLLGFVCPLMWYSATILYFGRYYHKDPRERSELAACAMAATLCAIAAVIALLVILL
ncbi:hypothetical protein GH714_005283 [Hevea brasiliensis]|uniref:Hexosyltransferase n=1 Tax=Hevea brasiliensis TaxID=3981 RepID=A0A6A6M9A3_HEVBR|nr:hypothetical protein GH714_005283 [Hevea brasiliensis]